MLIERSSGLILLVATTQGPRQSAGQVNCAQAHLWEVRKKLVCTRNMKPDQGLEVVGEGKLRWTATLLVDYCMEHLSVICCIVLRCGQQGSQFRALKRGPSADLPVGTFGQGSNAGTSGRKLLRGCTGGDAGRRRPRCS